VELRLHQPGETKGKKRPAFSKLGRATLMENLIFKGLIKRGKAYFVQEIGVGTGTKGRWVTDPDEFKRIHRVTHVPQVRITLGPLCSLVRGERGKNLFTFNYRF